MQAHSLPLPAPLSGSSLPLLPAPAPVPGPEVRLPLRLDRGGLLAQFHTLQRMTACAELRWQAAQRRPMRAEFAAEADAAGRAMWDARSRRNDAGIAAMVAGAIPFPEIPRL